MNNVPIQTITGVRLEASGLEGVATVVVENKQSCKQLAWDRFVRLKAAADAVNRLCTDSILDAGGYDGALAFFLDSTSVHVIDPATTGGSLLEMPVADQSYDATVAVDVLEHIEPGDRSKALYELARAARYHVVLNYPCKQSKTAQELVLRLTDNSLIREHVVWELPDSDWVLSELTKHGFEGTLVPHTSVAIWLGQYITSNLLPKQAKALNQYLVENHAEEPTANPLYHLIVANRTRRL